MSYEIITPDGNNLYLIVDVQAEDSLPNRKIVHKIRELVEELRDSKSTKNVTEETK